MPELLAIEGLRAGYGEAVVLPQLVADARRRARSLALLGRNGTGKTTLINSIVGVTRRFARPHPLDGARHHAAARRPARARRHRLGAAGAQHLPLADGRGEHDRGGAARAVDGRQGLRDVPAACRAAAQSRQPALRRRAADAGDRPRADAEPEAAAAGRAAGRARADHRRGTARRAEGASSASEGTCAIVVEQNAAEGAWRSPAARLFWNAARSSMRPRATRCAAIRRCSTAISASAARAERLTATSFIALVTMTKRLPEVSSIQGVTAMQRTKPPFRADEVGSLLRSDRVKDARAKLEKGAIKADELRKIEDSEIEKIVHKQASVGLQACDRRRVPPLLVAFRFPAASRPAARCMRPKASSSRA